MKGRIKRIFLNRQEEVRLVWLLAAAAAMYAASVLAYDLYWYVYRTMMGIWGVTSENIARAPGAVQFLYSWSNVLAQLVQNALLIAFAACLARMAKTRSGEKAGGWNKVGRGAGMGAVCIAAVWCGLMATGSVRLGWRIGKPEFSINTFALLLTSAAAALGEGGFLYGAVFGMMKKRLPMWAALAGMAVVNGAAAIAGQGLQVIMLLNSIIMALVCSVLTERFGVHAAIGFRFAWTYVDQAVFGFAGAAAALYETYPVNLYWLNGGNSGIMSGLMVTAALAALACWLLRDKIGRARQFRKRNGKSPS